MKWLRERYGVEVTVDELAEVEDLEAFVHEKGKYAFTAELHRLERFVLLQILDKTWKEHLYSMDQVKDSVGLRGYAEKDPRIEYKREGAAQYTSMQQSVRDQVTDLIFRARLTPNVRLNNAYGEQQQAQHAEGGAASAGGAPGGQGSGEGGAGEAGGAVATAAAAAATRGSADQEADRDAADRAGVRRDPSANLSRKQRRAAESRERRESSGPRKTRKRKGR